MGEGRTREMGQAGERDSDRARPGEGLTPQLVEGTASGSIQHSTAYPETPLLLSLEPLAQRFEKKAGLLDCSLYLVYS